MERSADGKLIAMVIDHIGIVVRSLEQGFLQWETMFGYRPISPIVNNTRQKVNVAFLSKENSIVVKLVEPSGPASSVAPLAYKGGGLHHLCFRCDALKDTIPLLREAGARFIVPPQPGEAFCNRDIAFFLTSGNLNFELIDSTEKLLFPSPEKKL
jgi:methylmalonyl-CoA/ethylmalonyl-CoA epimerase